MINLGDNDGRGDGQLRRFWQSRCGVRASVLDVQIDISTEAWNGTHLIETEED